MSERALVLIKPDAVRRGLTGEIISRFESRTLQIKAIKILSPSRELIERHYDQHRGKEHFERMVRYMTSGNVVAMILEGAGAIPVVRQMIGALDPLDAAPGTIRGDFTLSITENLVHGSDSQESAEREIAIWFSENEIVS